MDSSDDLKQLCRMLEINEEIVTQLLSMETLLPKVVQRKLISMEHLIVNLSDSNQSTGHFHTWLYKLVGLWQRFYTHSSGDDRSEHRPSDHRPSTWAKSTTKRSRTLSPPPQSATPKSVNPYSNDYDELDDGGDKDTKKRKYTSNDLRSQIGNWFAAVPLVRYDHDVVGMRKLVTVIHKAQMESIARKLWHIQEPFILDKTLDRIGPWFADTVNTVRPKHVKQVRRTLQRRIDELESERESSQHRSTHSNHSTNAHPAERLREAIQVVPKSGSAHKSPQVTIGAVVSATATLSANQVKHETSEA